MILLRMHNLVVDVKPTSKNLGLKFCRYCFCFVFMRWCWCLYPLTQKKGKFKLQSKNCSTFLFNFHASNMNKLCSLYLVKIFSILHNEKRKFTIYFLKLFSPLTSKELNGWHSWNLNNSCISLATKLEK